MMDIPSKYKEIDVFREGTLLGLFYGMPVQPESGATTTFEATGSNTVPPCLDLGHPWRR